LGKKKGEGRTPLKIRGGRGSVLSGFKGQAFNLSHTEKINRGKGGGGVWGKGNRKNPFPKRLRLFLDDVRGTVLFFSFSERLEGGRGKKDGGTLRARKKEKNTPHG